MSAMLSCINQLHWLAIIAILTALPLLPWLKSEASVTNVPTFEHRSKPYGTTIQRRYVTKQQPRYPSYNPDADNRQYAPTPRVAQQPRYYYPQYNPDADNNYYPPSTYSHHSRQKYYRYPSYQQNADNPQRRYRHPSRRIHNSRRAPDSPTDNYYFSQPRERSEDYPMYFDE